MFIRDVLHQLESVQTRNEVIYRLAEIAGIFLSPFEKLGKKIDGTRLSLQVNTANPGPYYTLPEDPNQVVSPRGLGWDLLRKAVYDHQAAINATLLPREVWNRALSVIPKGSTIVVPWAGAQFALGDTVLAASAWELMCCEHKVIVLADAKFGGIKRSIIERCAPSVRVVEVNLTDNLRALIRDELCQMLIGGEVILIPSNYGESTTGALLHGIEEALHQRPSVRTFVGFFDWLPAERKIDRAARLEIVKAGSNPIVAYLQSQVYMRMGVKSDDFIIPSFNVSEDERVRALELLRERGFDVENPSHLLVLVGDSSSHPFKRLSANQAENLLLQLVEEGMRDGKEVFFGLVDPGSSIDVGKLPVELASRVVYHARRDSTLLASHQVMACPRCLFLGCDSYVSHAFSAISRGLRDLASERRQVLLFGWWGGLDELTWLPCGPAEVLDAREFNGPKARVTTLQFGIGEEGEILIPILDRLYLVG